MLPGNYSATDQHAMERHEFRSHGITGGYSSLRTPTAEGTPSHLELDAKGPTQVLRHRDPYGQSDDYGYMGGVGAMPSPYVQAAYAAAPVSTHPVNVSANTSGATHGSYGAPMPQQNGNGALPSRSPSLRQPSRPPTDMAVPRLIESLWGSPTPPSASQQPPGAPQVTHVQLIRSPSMEAAAAAASRNVLSAMASNPRQPVETPTVAPDHVAPSPITLEQVHARPFSVTPSVTPAASPARYNGLDDSTMSAPPPQQPQQPPVMQPEQYVAPAAHPAAAPSQPPAMPPSAIPLDDSDRDASPEGGVMVTPIRPEDLAAIKHAAEDAAWRAAADQWRLESTEESERLALHELEHRARAELMRESTSELDQVVSALEDRRSALRNERIAREFAAARWQVTAVEEADRDIVMEAEITARTLLQDAEVAQAEAAQKATEARIAAEEEARQLQLFRALAGVFEGTESSRRGIVEESEDRDRRAIDMFFREALRELEETEAIHKAAVAHDAALREVRKRCGDLEVEEDRERAMVAASESRAYVAVVERAAAEYSHLAEDTERFARLARERSRIRSRIEEDRQRSQSPQSPRTPRPGPPLIAPELLAAFATLEASEAAVRQQLSEAASFEFWNLADLEVMEFKTIQQLDLAKWQQMQSQRQQQMQIQQQMQQQATQSPGRQAPREESPFRERSQSAAYHTPSAINALEMSSPSPVPIAAGVHRQTTASVLPMSIPNAYDARSPAPYSRNNSITSGMPTASVTSPRGIVMHREALQGGAPAHLLVDRRPPFRIHTGPHHSYASQPGQRAAELQLRKEHHKRSVAESSMRRQHAHEKMLIEEERYRSKLQLLQSSFRDEMSSYNANHAQQ